MLAVLAMMAAATAQDCEVREASMLLPKPKRPPCVAFKPARKMAGIWIDVFEGSSFREGAVTVAGSKSSRETVWLWITSQARSRLIRQEGSGHAYRVTFEGREAQEMHRQRGDGYGHFSMSEGLIMVDRLFAIEDLGCVDRADGVDFCTDLPVRP